MSLVNGHDADNLLKDDADNGNNDKYFDWKQSKDLSSKMLTLFDASQ